MAGRTCHNQTDEQAHPGSATANQVGLHGAGVNRNTTKTFSTYCRKCVIVVCLCQHVEHLWFLSLGLGKEG